MEQFCIDHPQPFTQEGWLGRIQTCNGVGAGAGMTNDDVCTSLYTLLSPLSLLLLSPLPASFFLLPSSFFLLPTPCSLLPPSSLSTLFPFIFVNFLFVIIFSLQLHKFNEELTQFMKANFPPNIIQNHRLFVIIVREKY